MITHSSWKPFVFDFLIGDWVRDGAEFKFSVSSSVHHRGPGLSATVYLNNGSKLEAVVCDEVIEEDLTFVIRASRPFQGRLVLA